MPEVSGAILAGGQSRRLGMNKAFAQVGGVALIDRVVSGLRQVSGDVLIVTNDPVSYQGLGVETVTDAWPATGCLGGIYSGLRAARHEHTLVVGCDMPFLHLGLLRRMIGLCGDYDVVIPRLGELLEPLHAIYSRACLKPIEELLQGGSRRIVGILGRVRVRYVDQAEILSLDPQQLSFFNVNTPQDLQRAEELAGRQRSQ